LKRKQLVDSKQAFMTSKSSFIATIINGILGSFTGTAAPVSGYMRSGKNFVRSRPRKLTAPMTPKRLLFVREILRASRALAGTIKQKLFYEREKKCLPTKCQ